MIRGPEGSLRDAGRDTYPFSSFSFARVYHLPTSSSASRPARSMMEIIATAVVRTSVAGMSRIRYGRISASLTLTARCSDELTIVAMALAKSDSHRSPQRWSDTSWSGMRA